MVLIFPKELSFNLRCCEPDVYCCSSCFPMEGTFSLTIIHIEGGRVQGWESVCSGVGPFPYLEMKNFQSFNSAEFQSSKDLSRSLKLFKVPEILQHFKLAKVHHLQVSIFKFWLSEMCATSPNLKFPKLLFSKKCFRVFSRIIYNVLLPSKKRNNIGFGSHGHVCLVQEP